jgi:ATP-dependent Clp protease ATP-binding subunit ClpA
VFERFTARARQVVVLAEKEARVLKHDLVRTEHILLGLLREEEGLAARVLESLDIRVERVRAQVVHIVGTGEEVTYGEIPLTPEAKQVLELALREALSLGHNHIGTEHILLGLVRDNEGVAARILRDFDADPEKVRNEVIRMLSGPGGVPPQRVDPRSSGVTGVVLDWAEEPLRRLAREVEAKLGRPADAGDLLVLLASVPEGLAARTLAALGVDAERLARAAEESRRSGARSAPPPDAALLEEAEALRAEKEAAIEAQEFARAANLRDRERELRRQAKAVDERFHEEILAEVRAHLGISDI